MVNKVETARTENENRHDPIQLAWMVRRLLG
jgi:hypothetical protein